MIQANELRIGNWLLFDSHISKPEYIQVTARFFSGLAGGRPLSELSPDDEISIYHNPIPLTPEILEKAGFGLLKKATTQKWVKYGIHPFELKIGAKRDSYPFYLQGYKFYPYPLYYLHQLQNLYFALTGNELKISL